MADCTPQPYIPAVPLVCAAPFNVTPCLNGEQCIDVIDAGCVAYNGAALTNIAVNAADRLDVILGKLNVINASAGIVTTASTSVSFTGTGLGTAPLAASVIVDSTITTNILVSGTNGLKVELTTAVILAMLNAIEASPVLQAKFCEAVANCTSASCGIPTSISASMS